MSLHNPGVTSFSVCANAYVAVEAVADKKVAKKDSVIFAITAAS